MSDVTVICGARESHCECVLVVGHEGAHECDEGCNGSWTFDAAGEFVVVRLPLGTGQGRVRSDSADALTAPGGTCAPVSTPYDFARWVAT